MSSSYFTFLNFKKNIRINIFITIQYLKTLLFGPPLIFAFLVLSVHIPGLKTNRDYPLASRASDLENLLALLNSTSPDFFPGVNLFACTTVSIKTYALHVNYRA